MASARDRSAAATDSSADCARVRIICAVTRLTAKSASARRRTPRGLTKCVARRIPHPTIWRRGPPAVTSYGTMAFSNAAAQAAASRRPVAGREKSAMMAVAIVMVVMPVPVRIARPGAHGEAARLADLPRLRFHASSDLRNVGNDIGTEAHRIGCACLTNGIADLGNRASAGRCAAILHRSHRAGGTLPTW